MRTEIIDKISTLMISAFGLVAALAWNDAITSLFKEGGPLHFMSAYGPFAYAIIVTILVVVLTIWIIKFTEKSKTIIDTKQKK